jgi:hypothetical protein
MRNFLRDYWPIVVVVVAFSGIVASVVYVRHEAGKRLDALEVVDSEVVMSVKAAREDLDWAVGRARAAESQLSQQIEKSAKAVAGLQKDVAAGAERTDKIVTWSSEHVTWVNEQLAMKADKGAVDGALATKVDKEYVDNKFYYALQDAEAAKKEAAAARYQMRRLKKELAEKEAAAQATATAEATPPTDGTANADATAEKGAGDDLGPKKWVRVSFEPAL